MKTHSDESLGIMVDSIRLHTEEYLREHPIKSMILGISGGIDSALVAALMKPVCDKAGIPLIGRSISIETNKEDEKYRAREIGNIFCTKFDEVDLSRTFITVIGSLLSDDTIDESLDIKRTKIRYGNIKARMRMLMLYDLAGATSGFVLSTDNLTEYNLGFWTLHGDVGDYGPIQQLWKTEIYALSDYLCRTELKDNDRARMALMSCIECNATDGLGITSTDLDQIMPDWHNRHSNTRSGYEEVDDILVNYLNTLKDMPTTTVLGDWLNIITDLQKNPVIRRHLASEFKRTNPYRIPRNKIIN